MAQIADDELTCPRCGGQMDRGFIDGGKGPIRWVVRPNENKTIFGGDRLADPHWVWGHRVIPAARCKACQIGTFAYDPTE
jgi:hypothetical protein